MNIRDCWMTLLEIKERLQKFKLKTNGKESFEPGPAWPFPKTRPGNEGDSDYEN
jgi:hypothetical protein